MSGTATSTVTPTTSATVGDTSFRDDGDRGDIDPIGGGNGVDNADHPNNQSNSRSNNNNNNDVDDEEEDEQALPPPGEATLLVSEFPPPPFYYVYSHTGRLNPPEIPQEALIRGTLNAAANAARQRAEVEQQQRLAQKEGLEEVDQTGAVLGGIDSTTISSAGPAGVDIANASAKTGTGENRNNGINNSNNNNIDLDDDDHTIKIDNNEGGKDDNVVGVFGEIVEDPLMVRPLDVCEDPTVVRDEVKRLNRQVVQGFVRLVQDLVNRPAENKKQRDELSHNVFLMIQEANKFREHQARELLIDVLERQLAERLQLITELQERIEQADVLL
jgi:hypothetical protein